MTDSGGSARRGRFIAGALCPACGEMDRLVVEPESDSKSGNPPPRRCVACGYTDALQSASSQVPNTRLTGGLRQLPETPSRPVRILDPPDAKR